MSQVNALYIKALPAEDLVTRFIKMAPVIWPNETLQCTIQTNLEGFTVSIQCESSSIEKNQTITDFLKTVKGRKHVLAKHLHFYLPQSSAVGIQYNTDDGIAGRISVNMTSSPDRINRTLDIIEKTFNVTSYVDLVGNANPAVADALAMRERSVADLQETVKKLAEFQVDLATREAERREEMQTRMNEAHREHLSGLDSAHRQRTDELDKEYRDRQADLDSKRQSTDEAFAKREKDYQERVAQFETKEAKYMRRELLKQIEKTLKEAESMALSVPTSKKRWPIFYSAIAMMIVSGSFAGLMIYKIFTATQPDWHHLGPLGGSFVTFVFTMVYFLKWNDRWFREHADAEFAAKRYKADILRASWVAELVTEWAKEGKGDLPPELVAAYTRNLFQDVGSSRVSEHPLDHLTSIMKRATEFDIGKGVFSVRSKPPTPKP